jgi:tRNA threonylcarbamoyl adenosine modification protein (Sua5/YciO/YrdC/YwlC family)
MPRMSPAPRPVTLETDDSGIHEAARILRQGGVVLVPTESSLALAADPRQPGALARVRAIKGRGDADKPLLLLAASREQAAGWASIDARAEPFARAWPAPLTLVLAARDPEAALRLGAAGIAVRVPAHPVARRLAQEVGAPITGTSANRAGESPLLRARDAASAFAGIADAVIDAGDLPGGLPSTLVDLRGDARILRIGAMPHAALHALLAGAHGLSSDMLWKVVGLTGPNSSGKGATADVLVSELGYAAHSLSDVVRDEARRRGLEPVRDVLIPLGNELRQRGGPGALAERILPRLEPPALVDSIRNPAEVAVLRRLDGFVLLAIDAPVELRFRRSLERGRPGDALTLEEFREKERRENSTDPLAQQLAATAALADRVLVNDSSLEDLRARLLALMRAPGT